jgi:hypothetical protein
LIQPLLTPKDWIKDWNLWFAYSGWLLQPLFIY